MAFALRSTPADRRLLPEGRFAGPMPWVIAIMMFLTALATATAMGLSGAAANLRAELSGRVTVQIVDANPDKRARQTAAAMAELGKLRGVRAIRKIPDEEIAKLLEPWLGHDGIGSDLPVPALIDVDLDRAADVDIADIATALKPVAPSARIDRHVEWLAPLSGLLSSLTWLAIGIVMLMTVATAAAVVLAARGALNTHRTTIEILHLLGATDIQITRLFQRRIALDSLFGGLVGFAGAVAALLLIGARIGAVGSELLASAQLPWTGWLILASLPLLGGVLAMVAARLTIMRALRKIL